MLDYIDEHIIEKLKHDGRTSLTDLSEGSDLSRVAIANRIEKLQQNGLLKVSALLNIEKLNYNTLIVELQVANEKKAEFRKMISGCSKVMQAFEISGQHNHLLICSAKNNNLLRSIKIYSIIRIFRQFFGENFRGRHCGNFFGCIVFFVFGKRFWEPWLHFFAHWLAKDSRA